MAMRDTAFTRICRLYEDSEESVHLQSIHLDKNVHVVDWQEFDATVSLTSACKSYKLKLARILEIGHILRKHL